MIPVTERYQYLTFPSDHLISFIVGLAREHEISIVGSIVQGTLPESALGSPFPSASPFSHIPLHSSVGFISGKITESQLAWAKYLQQYPQSAKEDAEPVLRNTALFIEGASGQIQGEYSKRNLWHPERYVV